MSQKEEAVKKIIDRYNSGDVEGAKNLLTLSSWILPESTKSYLYCKIYKTIDEKTKKFLIEVCEIMGGGKIIHNNQVIYEHKKEKENESGEGHSEGDIGVAH